MPETEELLCIGGPCDGQRVSMHKDVRDLIVPRYEGEGNNGKPKFGQIVYTKMYIHGDTKRFCILIYLGMTANDLFEKLIENYKGED